MEAQSLIQSKCTIHPFQCQRNLDDALNSIPKLASIPSTKVAKRTIFSRTQWNCRGERLRRKTRLICCARRVEVAKGDRFGTMDGRKKLAVFVSGGGSNFRSIYEATLDGSVNGEVVVLVTNKPGGLLVSHLHCEFPVLYLN